MCAGDASLLLPPEWLGEVPALHALVQQVPPLLLLVPLLAYLDSLSLVPILAQLDSSLVPVISPAYHPDPSTPSDPKSLSITRSVNPFDFAAKPAATPLFGAPKTSDNVGFKPVFGFGGASNQGDSGTSAWWNKAKTPPAEVVAGTLEWFRV